MAWPKGVPRKLRVEIPPVTTTTGNTLVMEALAASVTEKFEDDGIQYAAIFGVRRHHGGNFAGLWELVKIDKRGKRIKVLTDANSKQMIIRMIGAELVRCIG